MAELFHKLSPAAQRELLEGPAIRPPHNVTPNLTNPPNRRELGWIVTILCSALSALSVAIRLYSRIVCAKKGGVAECKHSSRILRRPTSNYTKISLSLLW
jgi:hypothetical protein